MADDGAVVYSIGYVEGWIETAASKTLADGSTLNNVDAVKAALKTVEDGYHDYRRKIVYYQSIIQDLQKKINAVAVV